MRLERERFEGYKEGFDDSHDVEKHFLSIHSTKLLNVLTDDLLLAVFTDQEKRFITSNIDNAHECLSFIADPKEADRCATRLLLKAYLVAVLNRNVKNNPMLQTVLSKVGEEVIQGNEPNIDQRMLEKLDKENKRGQK